MNPVPPEGRLQPLEPFWYMRRYEEAFLTQINDNLERLNQLLWGPGLRGDRAAAMKPTGGRPSDPLARSQR